MRVTLDIELVYNRGKDTSNSVVEYVDFDYRDLDKRRSLIEYVFTLCDGAISWKTTLQSTVALSTIEAKYITTTKVVNEGIWLRGLVGDLCIVITRVSYIRLKIRCTMRGPSILLSDFT